MKNRKVFLPVLAALSGAALVLASCAASPSPAEAQTNPAPTGVAEVQTSPVFTDTAEVQTGPGAGASITPLPASEYWTGDGGAGLSVAVLAPEANGLDAGEEYLPAMVQGVLVGDFTKFSAITVLDRLNLDKVIAEGETGYYADESDFPRLGEITNMRYLLTGALQKTGAGFSLQLKITEAATGVSKAAYTGGVTAAELEDLTGVKRASADLLAQLGVSLTEAGKTNLAGVDASNARAETALARGITAQRGGTVVEALSYYYEAAKFDPGLAEAASRSSVLSADITGGNIGQNVRNDIQRRNAWNSTFQEAAAFFKQHPPFELVYDPALTWGEVDYEKETAELSFKAILIGTTGFKIIHDLDRGLDNTGRRKDWGIDVDSIYREIPRSYEFDAVLVNEDEETIGRTTVRFQPGVTYNYNDDKATVVFSGVDANKITDRLTVSIVGVNGMNAKTAGEQGYMGISPEDFTSLLETPPFEFRWRLGGIMITRSKGNDRNIVIPPKIGRWPVTSIGDDALFPNNRPKISSVTIPSGVTSIGDRAFSYNDLASVTIPDSVTSIGGAAFAHNRLTGLTIPDSVTFIDDQAFTDNPLTSITLPANVNLDYDAVPCQDAYEANGRKAGTYVKQGVNWVLQ